MLLREEINDTVLFQFSVENVLKVIIQDADTHLQFICLHGVSRTDKDKTNVIILTSLCNMWTNGNYKFSVILRGGVTAGLDEPCPIAGKENIYSELMFKEIFCFCLKTKMTEHLGNNSVITD